MADSGLTLVRIGEFAWSTYQPARDRFEWAWLDEAIETLAGAGLEVVLCTPTATPPVWLVEQRPEILSVGPDGRRRAYGSRRHTCSTSPEYREEAERVVMALLDRYAGHPVTAWQVDNELGNHDSARCWCDRCQLRFSEWLEDRFGSIDALNRAWGTAFWSMTYPSFASVRLPVPTMTSHNPSLRLAHAEFASQKSVEFFTLQANLIRAAVGPDVPITTNFYSEDTAVDQRAAARVTGVAAIDSYPHGPADPLVTAYHIDLSRSGAGQGGSAWIMEQQAGPINWTPNNPAVAPGQVRLWTWQAALHGVDTLLYFRWRAARYGQEMYHSGLLRHDGSPTGFLQEVAGAIEELREVGLVAPPAGRVAILHSAEDVWALEISPHLEGLRHRDLQMGAYRALRRLGLDVEFRHPTENLTDLEWVIAPALHITSAARVKALQAALDAGVGVVLGPRSLVVDENHAWSEGPLPGGLADRLGACLVSFGGHTPPPRLDPWGVPAGRWVEILELEAGEALATVSEGPFQSAIAAARNGNLVYAGFSSAEAWTALLSNLLDRRPQDEDGVESFERSGFRYRIDYPRARLERSQTK
jgi:beta-galactosidase